MPSVIMNRLHLIGLLLSVNKANVDMLYNTFQDALIRTHIHSPVTRFPLLIKKTDTLTQQWGLS